MTLVRHHIKYKSIHGEEIVVLMDKGEHTKLHRRLRKEGKCNIPSETLHSISLKENRKYYKQSTNVTTLKWYYRNRDKQILKQRLYNHKKDILCLRPDIISRALLFALSN